MELEVLYEDEDIIVVVKPRGIATQTANVSRNDMVSIIRNYRVKNGESNYVGVLSRLDQNVRGILVFGKNKNATSNLSKQIDNKSFYKVYEAEVFGIFNEESGKIENYIKKDTKNKKAIIVDSDTPNSKKAILYYNVIEKLADTSRLEVRIDTGRFHQIRCQLAGINHPIIGDIKYGSLVNGEILKLEAKKVHFFHPKNKKEMEFCL